MGNRFRDMPGYKSTIRGHGIVAAIVFLLVVPAAIMIAKFFDRNPRLALRLHIWLQVITVFLVTAAFALGWLAVGPARSLTNPHHGIGLAIYVMVLVQVIWGSLIHRTEKGRDRLRIPLKLFVSLLIGTTCETKAHVPKATPMARSIYRPARLRPGRPRSHPLWITESFVHFVCALGGRIAASLPHSQLPSSSGNTTGL